MKKILFLFLISVSVFAQTGIGTTTPNASAKLEVNASDKGFLPPRVALTSMSVFAPVTGLSGSTALASAAGLLVYNTTSNAEVSPGFYYWSGTAWIRLTIPSDNASNVTGTVAVANGGTGTSTGSITGSGALTFTAGGTNQNIILNPSGTGYTLLNNSVGLGTNTPVDRLDVRSAMSVNEIKFRGTDGGDDSDPYRLRKIKIGDLNELQLHLNDDWNERFAFYGNSCLYGGCSEYSPTLYHYFRSDGNAYHAGNVGIGTTSPSAPLHVATSVSQYVSVYGYLNQNQAQGAYTANTNVYYSIVADQRIRCPEFNAISDVRIKKDILKLNTGNTLSELNKLQVVNYAYIDQLANGNKTKTGFIAQEVEAVNDQFVNQSTDFIPSVFALAKSVSLQEDALKISTEKPHDFAKGDVVKFFAQGKKEVVLTIESITDSHTFTIKGWTEATDNIFIYGKKINDFRAIDFDQITALSVGAIQELSKQMDSLKLENEKLNKAMQQKQADLENRLKIIELKLK
ncbi:tail fiber domain-containing protein [Aquirufa antheringensis]